MIESIVGLCDRLGGGLYLGDVAHTVVGVGDRLAVGVGLGFEAASVVVGVGEGACVGVGDALDSATWGVGVSSGTTVCQLYAYESVISVVDELLCSVGVVCDACLPALGIVAEGFYLSLRECLRCQFSCTSISPSGTMRQGICLYCFFTLTVIAVLCHSTVGQGYLVE